MAFQAKRIYHGLNAAELKDIIPARAREAMELDNTLNVGRGFPLLRYEIKITLTPYHSVGFDRSKVEQLAPDQALVYVCDGEYFLPVETEALELVEESPLYGKEADPQELRDLAKLGRMDSLKTNTGELVDVRLRPGTREPAVELALVNIPDASPTPPVPTPFDPSAKTVEDADTTLMIEEHRWRGAHIDDATDRAVGMISRDPTSQSNVQEALRIGGGRVSIIGGQRK